MFQRKAGESTSPACTAASSPRFMISTLFSALLWDTGSATSWGKSALRTRAS